MSKDKVNVMWENETVVLVTSLKKRILGGRDSVRVGKILDDKAIPVFIKGLFNKRVEHFLTTESPFSVKTTQHFHISESDVKKLESRFLEILRENASFNEKEVENVLHDALVIRLDYLVKPVDTMRRLIFENGDIVETKEVEEKTASFEKLLPYADNLLNECKKRVKETLDVGTYAGIVSDITQNVFEKNPIKAVMDDFSVLTEFLSETKGEEITRIEGSAIQEFLIDRNLLGFKRALDVEIKLGKEDFEALDLEMTMLRYVELKNEFSNKTDKKEKMTDVEDVVKTEDKIVEQPNEVEKNNESETSVAEDVWQLDDVLDVEEYGVKETKIEEILKLSSEKQIQKPMKIIRREKKDKREETEETAADRRQEKGADEKKPKSISNSVDEKTEKAFVKKLFGGDVDSYKQLMNKLIEAESWRVAKILIDNELFKRDVDPFSREAIKLVDIVYSRYYPEEGVGGGK